MNLMRALRVQRGDVITLVGGGGKTTLMFALATDVTLTVGASSPP